MTLESFAVHLLVVWLVYTLVVLAAAGRYAAGLIALLLLAVFFLGCAHATRICEYDETTGKLTKTYTTSTIVGKGLTVFSVKKCAGFTYGTVDTGISDNGVKLGESIAKGAVKGAAASTGIGAVGPALKLLSPKGGE